MRPLQRSFALILLASAPAVHAASCTLDGGPAATLLLPYFEVDLASASGRTTLLSINNAREPATLAHVVLWTDLAVPTLGFDVYLTGWDVQTINLRDVFQGVLPRTADAAHDPADTVSPRGFFSLDAAYPGCAALPPQNLPADLAAQLRRAHTGQSPLLDGQCVGRDLGDTTVARGYATVDVVKDCTLLRPGDAGYFGQGGVAAFDNALWGDFFYVDPAGRFAQGENLVRIEADPARAAPGNPTFYGRYVFGSAADGREPLPVIWAARFLTRGAFNGGTDLVVWRSLPLSGQPFACSTVPPGLPRAQQALFGFDEEEETFNLVPPPPVADPEPPPTPPRAPFSAAASRLAVRSPALPVPADFGWLEMDLRPHDTEPADPFAQAWVGEVHSAQGRFSLGLAGTQLANPCFADRCSQGASALIGQLCVVGSLEAHQPAKFQVRPQGCFSSGCTQILHTGCAVERNGADLRLDALFCLQPTFDTPCTADCSGGGFAQCSSGPLDEGTYTARLGALTLNFQVPGEGGCVGEP